MRLILIIALIYLGYRVLKFWILSAALTGKTQAGNQRELIDDVMVKDPFCGAYFPERNGVNLRKGGEELLFCSTGCRDKYLLARSEDGE
ncbi:MAG: hypothetical protein Q8P24_15010 [Desulfobacterales bacterium]|nr:hypothetical protein [Desulfobacterales bacterium]